MYNLRNLPNLWLWAFVGVQLFVGCKDPSPKAKKSAPIFQPATSNSDNTGNSQVPQTSTQTPAVDPVAVQTVTSNSDCPAEQKLTEVAIVLNGAIEAPVLLKDSAKDQTQNQGIAGQMTFEFNTGLSYTATDAIAQLKANQGRIVIKDFASYTLSQIQYVKISLDGHAFENTPFSEWDFWKGQETRYKVYETNRFVINSISIVVNGQEFYRQGSVKKTLSAASPAWKDENLDANLVTSQIRAKACTKAASTATDASESTTTTK